MDIKLIYILSFISFLFNYVSANLGLFGYDAFATHKLIRTPMEQESECVKWKIKSSPVSVDEGTTISDESMTLYKFAEVEINAGCTTGIKLAYNDESGEVGFFSPFEYYSDLEIDLIVLKGKLDIRLEEPNSDKYIKIQSADETEFTDIDAKKYNFKSYVAKFPEFMDGEYSVINFSNPDPEKSVKFYMRKARLIYITPRTVLDNLKLYGNDWSYNVLNSTFINNVMHKYLYPHGCISIDLKDPYVDPWASIRMDIKAPSNFVLFTGMEIEGILFLRTYWNETEQYQTTPHFSEDDWNTIEIEFKNIRYDKLYDRLDICNGGQDLNWLKVKNIYFEPKYKYESKANNAQSCCAYNQCICTVQRKKVYVRRKDGSISDSQLNNNSSMAEKTIYSLSITLIFNILMASLLLLFI